jgi:hypothetical protein
MTSTPRSLKQTENRREVVLFIIEDLSIDVNLLPIISTLQAYVRNGAEKHEGWCSYRNLTSDFGVSIDLLLPNNASPSIAKLIVDLVPAVREIFSVDGPRTSSLSSYDCIFSLNTEEARIVGASSRRHLAQSFGILCGADSRSMPNVENLLTEFDKDARFIVCGPSWSSAYDLDKCYPWLMSYKNVDDLILTAHKFAGYVGPANFVSYLMCCLGKPVLEISSDFPLTKWDNKEYHLLTDSSSDSVLKGVKRCFPQLLRRNS